MVFHSSVVGSYERNDVIIFYIISQSVETTIGKISRVCFFKGWVVDFPHPFYIVDRRDRFFCLSWIFMGSFATIVSWVSHHENYSTVWSILSQLSNDISLIAKNAGKIWNRILIRMLRRTFSDHCLGELSEKKMSNLDVGTSIFVKNWMENLLLQKF